MWTVVYVAQDEQETFNIKEVLENNKIISRTRKRISAPEETMCFEIMVPSQELALAQDLIIASQM